MSDLDNKWLNAKPSKSHPKWSAERIKYVTDNEEEARKNPRAIAEQMKAAGMYSQTTYVGDIERAVRKIIIAHGTKIEESPLEQDTPSGQESAS